jgi:hypothetical protein
VRTVTVSLLFQVILAPLAVALILVLVGVTVIVDSVPTTVSVVGAAYPVTAVTASLLFQAVLAPLAVAFTFVVVAVISVTTPTLPVDALSANVAVIVGYVTVNVAPSPITVSVVGDAYPVTAETVF